MGPRSLVSHGAIRRWGDSSGSGNGSSAAIVPVVVATGITRRRGQQQQQQQQQQQYLHRQQQKPARRNRRRSRLSCCPRRRLCPNPSPSRIYHFLLARPPVRVAWTGELRSPPSTHSCPSLPHSLTVGVSSQLLLLLLLLTRPHDSQSVSQGVCA